MGETMKYLYTFLILLLAVAVSAVDLDSTRQVRVAAYRLLQMDTTGTSALSTTVMDRWANIAINRVNEDLCSYRRYTYDTTADGQRLYGIDSCIQIFNCLMVTNDSIWALKFVDIYNADSAVFGVANFESRDWPTHYFFTGDSVGLLPSPIRDKDSIWTFYNSLIPKDSMRLLPYNHRFGVVLYTAYLAALDVDKDATKLLTEYDKFVMTRKPKAIEGK